MGTRAIHTVFTVSGESEYRTAVRNINAAIKELNSEIELSKEKFAGQEDSYEALLTKQQQIQKMYDLQSDLARTYSKRMEDVAASTKAATERSEELKRQIESLTAKMKEVPEGSEEYESLSKQVKEATKELASANTQIEKNAIKTKELQTGVNKATLEMEKMGKELRELDPLVKEAESSTDGYARSMREAAEEAEDLGKRGNDALEALASAEIMDRARDGFRELMDAIGECTDSYITFESAMAGVRKTVDATDEQFAVLTEGIRDMARRIPASAEEIAGVAEAAGQLGIATDNVLEFTEVMIKLGTSTNMSATEAANTLARFGNIVKLEESNYERLGSTIVDLGNKFATTETEIAEMATRLAATGELVGLSEADILGMATALSSLGIEAEAGGSAASKLFKKLETAAVGYEKALSVVERTGVSLRELELLESNQSKVFKETADSIGVTATELGKYMDTIRTLEQIATVSGTTAEEFVKAWGQNAVGALDSFVTGLGNMEESGVSAVDTLNQIAGFTEVRLSNAILSLASSGGLLTEAMDTANAAWEENSALAEEAAKRYATTESKITVFQNTVEDLKISIGEDFLNAAEPMIEGLTEIAGTMADAADESPALATGLAAVGGALGGLAALTTVASGIKLVASAMSIFGAAAGPVGIGVAALGALAAAVAVYQANASDMSAEAEALAAKNEELLASVRTTNEEAKALTEDAAKKQENIQGLIEKVDAFSDSMEKTPAAVLEVQTAIDELNELLPGLGLEYDEVTGKVNLTAEAMRNFAKTSAEAAELTRQQEYIKSLTTQQEGLQKQLQDTATALTSSKEKMKEARENLAEYTEGMTAVEKVLAYTSPQFYELKDAVTKAENEVSYFTVQHGKLQSELAGVSSRLDDAKKEYSAYAEAMADAEEEAEKLAEAQTKAKEKYLEEAQAAYDKEKENAEKAYTERVESYQESLEDELSALEETQKQKTRELEAQQRQELRDFKDLQEEKMDALEDALDEELSALEDQYREKKKLIDEEYEARLKLIDETRYNEIQKLNDQIAVIEGLTEAEEKALKERNRQQKIADAERAIIEAETIEERIKAEQKYNDVLADIERERTLEQREAQIEALEEQKKVLEDEFKLQEEALEKEKKAALESAEQELADEKTALQEEYAKRKKELQRAQEEELIIFRQGQSDQMDVLKKSHADQVEEKKKFHEELLVDKQKQADDERQIALAEAEQKLADAKKEAEDVHGAWMEAVELTEEDRMIAETFGKALADGFVSGLLGEGDRVKAAAETVAKQALEGMRGVLEIRSPSRKAREIGHYFGDGMVIGLDDKIADVKAAMRRMGAQMQLQNESAKAATAGAETRGADASSYGGGESVGKVENNWYVTLDAANVKEFNDIVRMAEQQRQSIRMGYKEE